MSNHLEVVKSRLVTIGDAAREFEVAAANAGSVPHDVLEVAFSLPDEVYGGTEKRLADVRGRIDNMIQGIRHGLRRKLVGASTPDNMELREQRALDVIWVRVGARALLGAEAMPHFVDTQNDFNQITSMSLGSQISPDVPSIEVRHRFTGDVFEEGKERIVHHNQFTTTTLYVDDATGGDRLMRHDEVSLLRNVGFDILDNDGVNPDFTLEIDPGAAMPNGLISAFGVAVESLRTLPPETLREKVLSHIPADY